MQGNASLGEQGWSSSGQTQPDKLCSLSKGTARLCFPSQAGSPESKGSVSWIKVGFPQLEAA